MIVCVSAGRATPAEVRERLLPDASDLLTRAYSDLGELMLLSTCHRVELYATVQTNPEAASGSLLRLFEAPPDADVGIYVGEEAINHLFRVTAGLDSLVVGEPQIQAQVRRALYDARRVGSAGPALSTLVSHALKAGRRARKETALGAIGESLGTAAARLLEDRLGSLTKTHGLIVGAGIAAEDAAIAVRARGADLRIVSRNPAHAHALAARLDADTGDLNDLSKLMLDAAFVIVAISGGELVTARHGSKALILDLSVPHAVAPGLGALKIDDLPPPQGAQVNTGVAEASVVVAQEALAYRRWLETRDQTGEAIRALHAFAAEVTEHEVARTAKNAQDAVVLQQMAERIAAKLLHKPVSALRNADPQTVAWLSELLGLTSKESD